MSPTRVPDTKPSEPSCRAVAPSDALQACSLTDFVLYFLRLGTLGFGGPIALAGYMQRDLVEDRRWLSKQDYVEGLALAQLAPGPLAAQLAIYLGWVRGGVLGATWVGLAFVLPSFVMVLGLSVLYVRFGGLPWMRGAFYGFLSILHAITVIAALLYLPFGKFFHIFQRPAQLGVKFYHAAGDKDEGSLCARCGQRFASRMHVQDLKFVLRQLGYDYAMPGPAGHWQQLCPACKRKAIASAQLRLKENRHG